MGGITVFVTEQLYDTTSVAITPMDKEKKKEFLDKLSLKGVEITCPECHAVCTIEVNVYNGLHYHNIYCPTCKLKSSSWYSTMVMNKVVNAWNKGYYHKKRQKAQERLNAPKNRYCIECGAPLDVFSKQTKFCSRKCKERYRNKHSGVFKKCTKCGKEFELKRMRENKSRDICYACEKEGMKVTITDEFGNKKTYENITDACLNSFYSKGTLWAKLQGETVREKNSPIKVERELKINSTAQRTNSKPVIVVDGDKKVYLKSIQDAARYLGITWSAVKWRIKNPNYSGKVKIYEVKEE